MKVGCDLKNLERKDFDVGNSDDTLASRAPSCAVRDHEFSMKDKS